MRHVSCLPSKQDLERNSKLMIAKRYKRLCAAEKCVIELLCSVNRLREKEENTNNMNAVRHVLYVVFSAKRENFNQPAIITYHSFIS